MHVFVGFLLFINIWLCLAIVLLLDRHKVLEARLRETLKSLDIVRISQGKRF